MIADLSIAIPLAVACVLISAFCSGTEVALFSLRRIDREQLAKSDLAVDRRILRLLERPRRLIATVLIGSQTFNSILAVITLGIVIWLRPFESPWALGGIALAVALPLVVLIAEVTSKTLAAKAPLAWARTCAAPLSLFMLLVTPIRVIIQVTAAILMRPLGDAVRSRPARDLSEEEFRNLLDAGSAQGQVDARERRLIHRVFEFSDKNVGQVMTPRERIFALSYDLPMSRLVKETVARGFSRVPIYQKSLDNVRGILNAKDLVRSAAGQPLGRPLAELLHEPLFVPRTTPVKRLFLTFKEKKVHMAIVVSEYGKVLGLVTMDDLLAQIFGQLRDERAELQSSIPGRMRVRTPAAGAPAARESAVEVASGAGGQSDRVPEAPADPDATGPVKLEDMSGPVRLGDATGPVRFEDPPQERDAAAPIKRADTGPSGPVRRDGNGSGPITRSSSDDFIASGIVETTPPGLRPIHPVDEVTPPAVDVEELLSAERRSNKGTKPS